MARPELSFSDGEQELQYGLKVLIEAGVDPKDIEKIRKKHEPGVALSKDFVGLRRYMVQELLAAKLSNRQIANVLKVSKETVHADRTHNRELYTAKLLQSADVHRARLLKEQMELKDEALKGFEESKKKKVTTIQESDDGKGGTIVRVEESAGDHGFLNVAKNSLVEQAKLLGLNELKREENQDKSYRQFLQDLSTTIEKEKEDKEDQEIKENAVDISFDIADEPDKGPEGSPLSESSDQSY